MKKIVVILMLSLVGIGVKAVNQTFVATETVAPQATMQSVNKSTMMSSGSAYSSEVQGVGAANPASAMGPRKAPPTPGGGTSYDPTTPQYGPVGDAVLPFTLLSMVAAGVVYLRRRKQQA